ncbi:uncharacterized protein LOC128678310 [Plodia interpunctella]|uniref:uncharacterized protein LOC128678310 n=1 Tax=Plodia interpunctella TaxID=58824 RepID=UPI00236790E1|nr:uncharacterized protein LOC128678310 [Plodia interpunctella]
MQWWLFIALLSFVLLVSVVCGNPPNTANNVRYPPNTSKYPPNTAKYPINTARCPSDTVRHPPNTARHPPNTAKHTPNTPKQPPSTAKHPPNTAKYPPDTAIYPPNNGRKPGDVARKTSNMGIANASIIHTIPFPTNTTIAKYCFYAKNCTYNRKQVCGMNKKRRYKRFRDFCDMMKYNCNYRDNFINTAMTKCKTLPNLKKIKKKIQPWVRSFPITTTTKFNYPQAYVGNYVTTTKSPAGLEKMWVWLSDILRSCFDSKTCKHNGVNQCAISPKGELKLFASSCDLFEYNCRNNARFIKTAAANCRNLPPLKNNVARS